MKSAIQIFFFDILSKLLLGAMGIVLIRYMPENEYARYTLAVSLIAVATQTLVLSFNRIYIVGYERLDLEGASSSFLGFQLWGILALVVVTLPLQGFARGVYWLVVAVAVATCLVEFAKTFSQRELKFFRFSMIELARAAVLVGSVFALIYVVRYNLKAWEVLFVQAFSTLAVFLAFFWKLIKWEKLLRIGEAVRLALAVAAGEYRYLFGYFFVLAFFLQVSVFVLRITANDVTLATFGAAFRYSSILSLALAAVQVVLLPLIQRAQNIAELEDIYGKHKRMLLLFAPMVLFAAWIGQWIIPWVDKGKYPDAVAAFQILAVSTIVSFALSPHAYLVMRFEDFKFLFVLIGVALLLSIGLNVALISALGAVGAAIATLISITFVSGSQFLRARMHRKTLAMAEQDPN